MDIKPCSAAHADFGGQHSAQLGHRKMKFQTYNGSNLFATAFSTRVPLRTRIPRQQLKSLTTKQNLTCWFRL